MRRKTKIILTGCFISAMVIAGAILLNIHQRIWVCVKNSEPAPITQIQVSLGGKVINLGSIAPGASASGFAIPSADSDVEIRYANASGVQQSVRLDIYITHGFHGTIEVELRNGAVVSSRSDLH